MAVTRTEPAVPASPSRTLAKERSRIREIRLPAPHRGWSVATDRLFLLPKQERTLMAAFLRGEGEAALRRAIRDWGFTDFQWNFSPVGRPLPEAPVYHWRSGNHEWSKLYHERGYGEIDTRIARAHALRLPIAWDQASERGRSPKMDELLDCALTYGIGSGVMYMVADVGHNGIFVGFAQPERIMTQARLRQIEESLPHMIALTRYLTDALMRPLIESYSTPRLDSMPLSRREREVLSLTASGHSAKRAARKLGITERTVQEHLVHSRVKLGVDSRMEAVSCAVRNDLILNNLPK
jgi:LuxR family transcriptional regulator